MRHWGLNPDERTRVQAQRNAAVDVMNSDGYLAIASGRWKARYRQWQPSRTSTNMCSPGFMAPPPRGLPSARTAGCTVAGLY